DLGATSDRHGAFARFVCAAKLDRREVAFAAIPAERDPTGDRLLRGHQRPVGGDRLDQAHQSAVETLDPDEVMENALVDSQRSGGQRRRWLVADLDQAPASQGAIRGERDPVWLVQSSQGEPERRVAPPSISLGRGAQPGERRVELDASAEEHYVALEGRETEGPAKRFESRGRGGRRSGGVDIAG